MIETTKTRYSDEFFFYKNDKIIGNSLRYYGEYSQAELDFLMDIVNPSCIVYDVGANIGYHTTAFASKAKKVYSFEPNPHNYALLKKNTSALSNVTLVNSAVGNYKGTVKILDFDPENDVENYGSMKCGDTGVDVPIVTLDDCGFDAPDVIKIDVEGYEYQVILGCKKLLEENHRPMFYYEAHETEEFKEIYEFLEQYDYNFYWAFVSNYNTKNYKNNEQNIFGPTFLVSVVAWPKYLGTLPLVPVKDSTENLRLFKTKAK